MIKIARIAVTLGLLSSLGAQAYAAGLVVNDNDLRNDLAWLSDRGVIHLSLSTWPLSQEEIARALKKAKPSYSSEQVVLARINQRLSALKADFRVTGYTSTDQPGTPQGFGQTQPADNSLGWRSITAVSGGMSTSRATSKEGSGSATARASTPTAHTVR